MERVKIYMGPPDNRFVGCGGICSGGCSVSALTSVYAAHSWPLGPGEPKALWRNVDSKLITGRDGLRRRPSDMLYKPYRNRRQIV